MHIMDKRQAQKIKKLKSAVKHGRIEEINQYINESQAVEDLLLLRTNKVLQHIMESRRTLVNYWRKVREKDQIQGDREKNYVKVLGILSAEIANLERRIALSAAHIQCQNLYTCLYNVAITGEDRWKCEIENVEKELLKEYQKIPFQSNERGYQFNIDKYGRRFADYKADDEVVQALLINLMVSEKRAEGMEYYDCMEELNAIKHIYGLVTKYQFLYLIRDDLSFGRYYVEKVSSRAIELQYSNFEWKKAKISGERRKMCKE